jgi:hypothetical protein
MKKFHVKVAIKILEIYEIEAEDSADASELWGDGKLIHTNDEAPEAEVLSVEEV